MSKPADDFWSSIRRTAADVEHKLNLVGKTRVGCDGCGGTGHTESGYTDHDGHGSYWVPPVDCRKCGGSGRCEAACTVDAERHALRVEIKKMQGRLRKLKGGG